MDWKKIGKLLKSKSRRRKELGQEEPYKRDYSKMSDTDRRRAEAVDKANEKKKKEKESRGFSDGGTKSKLFDKLKKKVGK